MAQLLERQRTELKTRVRILVDVLFKISNYHLQTASPKTILSFLSSRQCIFSLLLTDCRKSGFPQRVTSWYKNIARIICRQCSTRAQNVQ